MKARAEVSASSTAKILTACFDFVITVASPAAAQSRDSIGTVGGKATDERGVPMPGVEVEILDVHRTGRTNLSGIFRIDSIPAGDHVLSARRLGFSPLVATIQVAGGETTFADMVMRPAVNVLASVLVKGDVLMRGVPPGFLERMHSNGQGTYITAGDIKRQNPHRVSDVLRTVPGVKVAANGEVFTSRGVVSVLSNACANGMPIYLDNIEVGGGTGGVPEGFIGDLNPGRAARGSTPIAGSTASARSIADVIPPERVVAIEVYSGPATVPLTLPAANSSCGAVFIWTR